MKLNSNDQYDFGGRLTEEFPSQIVVDITEVCNLACIHCPHPVFKNSQHYMARYLEPDLNSKMIDEVSLHGREFTQYIRYTSNGEPLIHPHAYQMLEEAVTRSGVYVTLTTNGTIMNEKRTQRLLDAGIHMIDISIDAFLPETYAKIRVKGDLKITRNNVLRLLEWRNESKRDTKIVLSFVETKQNVNEVNDFEHYWKDNGADFVVIRRQHSAAGAVTKVADFIRANNHGISRKPCLYPWERITLNAAGNLAFCPTDWTNSSTVQDFRLTTIRETWRSEYYKKLRHAHIRNKFDDFQFCKQCPDWQLTRWPEEGRSYADMISELSAGSIE